MYAVAVSKTRPKRYTNWYIKEWLRTCDVTQAKLAELMDANKTTVSHLVNNQIDYTPEYIRDVALALQIEPFELLLPPDRAFALRQYRASAEKIVTLAHETEPRTSVERLPLKVVDGTGTNG